MFKSFTAVTLILFTAIFAFAHVSYIDRLADGEFEEELTAAQGGSWGTDQVSWTQAANAPVTFRRAASGVLDDYFYCFGDQSACPGNAYNLNTGQWEPSTPPPSGYCNWVGITTNDDLYLIGWFGSSSYGNQIQKFVPTAGGPSGVWTIMANYPVARCGVAAAWDGGNFIYAAGGNPTNSDAYKYDIANNTWIPIASLPGTERYAGGAYVNDKFYVIGGLDSPTATREYDPVTSTWTFRAPAPATLYFPVFNTVWNNDYIFVIGGGGHASTWPPSNLVHVYNPSTDTWSPETSLPMTMGVNTASWVGNGVIMSAGGNNLTANVDWTFRGENFPGAGGGTDLIVTLTPVNPPIIIPAGGGSFSFSGQIENTTAAPINFDAWTEVVLPNGVTYGPLVLRTNLTIGAGATILRAGIPQFVPSAAPPGNYSYVGNAGTHPGTVIDYDDFDFTKLAGDAPSNHNRGWELTGWFDDETAGAAVPSELTFHQASPNPFNPATEIAFRLPEAGDVSLIVYDIRGREVARLLEGWTPQGEYSMTFNASGLSSGVYFAKLTAGKTASMQKLLLVK